MPSCLSMTMGQCCMQILLFRNCWDGTFDRSSERRSPICCLSDSVTNLNRASMSWCGRLPCHVVELQCGQRCCADGSELPVDMAVSIVDQSGGPQLVVAVIWDVSDRIDIERYQRVSEDLLAFLAGASGTTEEIVPQLLAILGSTLDFEFATAWRWDPDSELLHCEHVWVRNAREFESLSAASMGVTVRSGDGLPGRSSDRTNPSFNPTWPVPRTSSDTRRSPQKVCMPASSSRSGREIGWSG